MSNAIRCRYISFSFFFLETSCQNTQKHSVLPFKAPTLLSTLSPSVKIALKNLSVQKQNMIWNNNFLLWDEEKILGGHKIRYCLRSWLTRFAQFGCWWWWLASCDWRLLESQVVCSSSFHCSPANLERNLNNFSSSSSCVLFFGIFGISFFTKELFYHLCFNI